MRTAATRPLQSAAADPREDTVSDSGPRPVIGAIPKVLDRLIGEFRTAREMVAELIRYRELLLSLTSREIRVRYKQSVLGVAWALLLPLSMMLIFTFVFTRAIDITRHLDVAMPYAIFAYTGLLPWVFFATSLTQAVNSLVANASLLSKIYFPREMFPLSCVASAFVDFLIGLAVLIVLVVYYHVVPDAWGGTIVSAGHVVRADWTFTFRFTLLAIPLVVLAQLALTVGLAFLLAMANLFYRDVRQVFAVAIQLWMFLTNVLYPLSTSDAVTRTLLYLNPMTPILSAYRDLAIYGRWPEPGPSIYAAVVSVVLLLVGWRCFHAAEFKFAERV